MCEPARTGPRERRARPREPDQKPGPPPLSGPETPEIRRDRSGGRDPAAPVQRPCGSDARPVWVVSAFPPDAPDHRQARPIIMILRNTQPEAPICDLCRLVQTSPQEPRSLDVVIEKVIPRLAVIRI